MGYTDIPKPGVPEYVEILRPSFSQPLQIVMQDDSYFITQDSNSFVTQPMV